MFDGAGYSLCVRAPFLCLLRAALRVGDAGKFRESPAQEPCEPDAFAFPLAADAVHAVVPVAGPHQRKAVSARGEASLDCVDAVLVERGALLARLRLEEGVVLVIAERRPLQIG